MNLVQRAKNMITSPKTEWLVIDTETSTPGSLLTSYVIPMLLIGTVASFIGYGLIGMNFMGVKIAGINWGIAQAASVFIGGIISYFINSYVIDALAPSFGSDKNINKSAQLVAYASTASYIAGIFQILPGTLSWLAILGLYSIYLFWIGLSIMKKTPEDKKVGYVVVCALVLIVVYVIIGMVMTRVLYSFMGNPYTTTNFSF